MILSALEYSREESMNRNIKNNFTTTK
uniref:Uncharacterized protein n=1 Tax=Anguilla anguilla TaxID=7936 RepID=A0A0E9S1I9_ANGAN